MYYKDYFSVLGMLTSAAARRREVNQRLEQFFLLPPCCFFKMSPARKGKTTCFLSKFGELPHYTASCRRICNYSSIFCSCSTELFWVMAICVCELCFRRLEATCSQQLQNLTMGPTDSPDATSSWTE
jgi:hypothetical protein